RPGGETEQRAVRGGSEQPAPCTEAPTRPLTHGSERLERVTEAAEACSTCHSKLTVTTTLPIRLNSACISDFNRARPPRCARSWNPRGGPPSPLHRGRGDRRASQPDQATWRHHGAGCHAEGLDCRREPALGAEVRGSLGH